MSSQAFEAAERAYHQARRDVDKLADKIAVVVEALRINPQSFRFTEGGASVSAPGGMGLMTVPESYWPTTEALNEALTKVRSLYQAACAEVETFPHPTREFYLRRLNS